MIKDVIIHDLAVVREMAGAVSRVIPAPWSLPALFAPDEDAAKLEIGGEGQHRLDDQRMVPVILKTTLGMRQNGQLVQSGNTCKH